MKFFTGKLRAGQEHLMHFLQERFQSIAEASFRNWSCIWKISDIGFLGGLGVSGVQVRDLGM